MHIRETYQRLVMLLANDTQFGIGRLRSASASFFLGCRATYTIRIDCTLQGIFQRLLGLKNSLETFQTWQVLTSPS